MRKPPVIDDEPNDEPARYRPPGGSQDDANFQAKLSALYDLQAYGTSIIIEHADGTIKHVPPADWNDALSKARGKI